MVIAEHVPQKSHSDVETRPMAAAGSVPRRPTIEASIYCMMMLDSWDRIAGRASLAASDSCCLNVLARPSCMYEMSAKGDY